MTLLLLGGTRVFPGIWLTVLDRFPLAKSPQRAERGRQVPVEYCVRVIEVNGRNCCPSALRPPMCSIQIFSVDKTNCSIFLKAGKKSNREERHGFRFAYANAHPHARIIQEEVRDTKAKVRLYAGDFLCRSDCAQSMKANTAELGHSPALTEAGIHEPIEQNDQMSFAERVKIPAAGGSVAVRSSKSKGNASAPQLSPGQPKPEGDIGTRKLSTEIETKNSQSVFADPRRRQQASEPITRDSGGMSPQTLGMSASRANSAVEGHTSTVQGLMLGVGACVSSSAASRAYFQRSMRVQQEISARLESHLVKARADLRSLVADESASGNSGMCSIGNTRVGSFASCAGYTDEGGEAAGGGHDLNVEEVQNGAARKGCAAECDGKNGWGCLNGAVAGIDSIDADGNLQDRSRYSGVHDSVGAADDEPVDSFGKVAECAADMGDNEGKRPARVGVKTTTTIDHDVVADIADTGPHMARVLAALLGETKGSYASSSCDVLPAGLMTVTEATRIRRVDEDWSGNSNSPVILAGTAATFRLSEYPPIIQAMFSSNGVPSPVSGSDWCPTAARNGLGSKAKKSSISVLDSEDTGVKPLLSKAAGLGCMTEAPPSGVDSGKRYSAERKLWKSESKEQPEAHHPLTLCRDAPEMCTLSGVGAAFRGYEAKSPLLQRWLAERISVESCSASAGICKP